MSSKPISVCDTHQKADIRSAKDQGLYLFFLVLANPNYRCMTESTRPSSICLDIQKQPYYFAFYNLLLFFPLARLTDVTLNCGIKFH